MERIKWVNEASFKNVLGVVFSSVGGFQVYSSILMGKDLF